MRRILGLCGWSRVGKDEVGRILVDHHGYTRFAKGDLIKDVAYAINPTVLIPDADGPGYVLPLAELIDAINGRPWDPSQGYAAWEPAKGYDAVRRFLQDLPDCTVAGFGFDAWNQAVYHAIERSDADHVVLTRLCLPYEVDGLRAHEGRLVRVRRPGYGPANDHPNEVALDHVAADWTVDNVGTLEDLAWSVQRMVEQLW